MKDIARVTGVSHGTVSNVINKRGNVTSDKIKLVEDAARQLGYTANAQAQRLRKEVTPHVAVLFPDLFTEQYSNFFIALRQQLRQAGFLVSIHLTDGNADREADCVIEALGLCPTCLVVVGATPDSRAFQQCSLPVVLLDAPKTAANERVKCFGFDYAGIADALFEQRLEGCHRIALFGNSCNLTADQLMSQRLKELCAASGVDFQDYVYERRFLQLGAVELASDSRGYDLVITTSSERTRVLTEIFTFKNTPMPRMVQLTSRQYAPGDRAEYFELDYANLGRVLAEKIIVNPMQLPPVTYLPVSGFRFDFSRLNIQPHEQEISLLTLAGSTTDAIAKLTSHFKKRTGIRLRINTLPYDELHTTLSSSGASGHDMVRMDVVWRPRFETAICRPLTECLSDPNRLWEQFLPELESAYNSRYTLPIDPCVQMMLYRRDLFEDATLHRLYYEETRTNLQLPTDYDTFNRVARFFTRSYNPKSPVAYGTAATWGLATIAACDFLPRLRAMGGSIFNAQGRLQVDTPAMRQALVSYLDTLPYTSGEKLLWWNGSTAQFISGQVAMIPVFTNHASLAINRRDAKSIAMVDCAPLPGNKPCLGGGCIGIANSTRKTDACVEFLHWVYSAEISAMIVMQGGMTPVASVYRDEHLRSMYPWLGDLGKQFLASHRHHHSPYYPTFDDHKFEVILGNAVRNLAMNIVGMDEALALAQAACDQQFRFKI